MRVSLFAAEHSLWRSKRQRFPGSLAPARNGNAPPTVPHREQLWFRSFGFALTSSVSGRHSDIRMAKAQSTVLCVEDEENDVLLMQLAFRKEGLAQAFRTVNTGKAAIDYLSASGPYADREKFPPPSAVLLDLNLPEVHGFDVLKWIRASPLHTTLPVVVFTSSFREDDRAQAQLLGADDFIPKPNSPGLLREIVRTLKQRWLVPDNLDT